MQNTKVVGDTRLEGTSRSHDAQWCVQGDESLEHSELDSVVATLLMMET